jgi:hypothetical protein
VNGWSRFLEPPEIVEVGYGRTVRSEWAHGWLTVSVLAPLGTREIGRVEGVYDGVLLLIRAYDDGVSTAGVLRHIPRSKWWQVGKVLRALVEDKKVGRIKGMYWVIRGSTVDPGPVVW